LKTNLKGSLSINVYSINGQLVYSEKNNLNPNIKIDVSAWNSGLYIVEVTNGTQKAASRLVVN
jgi:hypothetical protein